MKREVHEWHEREGGENRYFRANMTWKGWVFRTTLKSDLEWEHIEEPSRELWEKLREIVFNKYQRSRVAWKLVEGLDKILLELPAVEGEEDDADGGVDEEKDWVEWDDDQVKGVRP